MTETEQQPRPGNKVRWIARIWSAVVFSLVIAYLVFPDEYATEPVQPADLFLLSLWVLAVLGLALAWRWEAPGALVAIGMMFLRELAFFLIKGFWFPAFLMFWLVIIPPAVLFLVAWALERRARRKPSADL